jgi:hypothetical protein
MDTYSAFPGRKPFGNRSIAAAGHFWESLVSGLPLRADGQLLAPHGAAAGNYGLAIGGLHTRPKTVRLGAAPIVRLKSSFRHVWKISIIQQLGDRTW